jgi:hypothetical protein
MVFDKNIPIYVRTKLGIEKKKIDNDFNYLLTTIFNIEIAPEIGEIPQWVKEKMKNQMAAG